MNRLTYPIVIEPIPEAEGGGFLASVPDLPGCMTDAETPEAALQRVRGAIDEWIDEARRLGKPVPRPGKRVA